MTDQYKIDPFTVPATLPTPPEAFALTKVCVQGTVNVDRTFDLAKEKDPLRSAVLCWKYIPDEVPFFVLAYDGVTEIYAQWQSDAHPHWGDWRNSSDDEPFSANAAAHWRAVDKRAKEIYTRNEGNRDFGDCFEDAVVEIAFEEQDAALKQASYEGA